MLEVETPLLVPSPGVDRHIEAYGFGEGPDGYLATSPEYHMKRLLAAGSGPIFQITRACRGGERGSLHNPEFSILEWYRPGWDHLKLMDEVEALLGWLARRHAPGHDFARAPYARSTYAEAFATHAGVEPHSDGVAALRAACTDRSVDLAPDDREGWLTWLQSSEVEPRLGVDRPEFVHLYPADQCALSRVRPGDPPVALRFELYCRGIELANGFDELTDPVEQAERIAHENRERAARGLATYPLDREFVDALADMPPSAGVAVGLDRVVMLLTNSPSIRDVILFPHMRPEKTQARDVL